MDPDGPKRSESAPMDVDDDAVSCRHPFHYRDFPSGESGPSSHPLPSHPTGLHGYPPLTMLSAQSSPANVHPETRNVYENFGLAGQHRDILRLQPPGPEPTTRKRKRTDDAPLPEVVEHDTAQRDGLGPPPYRRVRPRLRTREGREFSPLLIMSPTQGHFMEEETTLASHYPSNVTDPHHSIQRYFRMGNRPEHGPSMPRSDSSPKASDPEDHRERWRSDSANSLAEVALASTVGPKRGRLSTLEDFGLPRPFEEAQQLSSGSLVIHERGLEAGPLFLSKFDQVGAGGFGESATSTMPLLELSTTKYFDEPLCESPDSIDPAGPTIRVTQTEHDSRSRSDLYEVDDGDDL